MLVTTRAGQNNAGEKEHWLTFKPLELRETKGAKVIPLLKMARYFAYEDSAFIAAKISRLQSRSCPTNWPTIRRKSLGLPSNATR